VQELRAKAEAASYMQDDSDVDQKVSDAMTSAGAAQPSSSGSGTAATAGYGTIPNGLPSGEVPSIFVYSLKTFNALYGRYRHSYRAAR